MGNIFYDHPAQDERGAEATPLRCREILTQGEENRYHFCNTPITYDNMIIRHNQEGPRSGLRDSLLCSKIFNYVPGEQTFVSTFHDDYDRRFSAIVRYVYCRKCLCSIGCQFVRIVNKQNLYKCACFLIDDITVY